MTTQHEIKLSFKAIDTNLRTAVSKMCGCKFPSDNFCNSKIFQKQLVALGQHYGMQAYSFDLISSTELQITIYALGFFKIKSNEIRKIKKRCNIEVDILDWKMENVGRRTGSEIAFA